MLIKIFGVILSVFLAIDGVWLGLVARNFYQKQIGYLMKSEPNWAAALIFYVIFAIGLMVFVVVPALEKNSWQQALFYGAFFGFVTYATYDLTNLATIKDWPLLVTIVDLAWGATLSALVSVISFLISKKIGL